MTSTQPVNLIGGNRKIAPYPNRKIKIYYKKKPSQIRCTRFKSSEWSGVWFSSRSAGSAYFTSPSSLRSHILDGARFVWSIFSVPLSIESQGFFGFTYKEQFYECKRLTQVFKHGPHIFNEVLKNDLVGIDKIALLFSLWMILSSIHQVRKHFTRIRSNCCRYRPRKGTRPLAALSGEVSLSWSDNNSGTQKHLWQSFRGDSAGFKV